MPARTCHPLPRQKTQGHSGKTEERRESLRWLSRHRRLHWTWPSPCPSFSASMLIFMLTLRRRGPWGTHFLSREKAQSDFFLGRFCRLIFLLFLRFQSDGLYGFTPPDPYIVGLLCHQFIEIREDCFELGGFRLPWSNAGLIQTLQQAVQRFFRVSVILTGTNMKDIPVQSAKENSLFLI